MGKIKNLKSEIYTYLFNSRYKKECDTGRIIPFNDEFYSRFEGMYYNGLPIYFYLEQMSMGKCYDASAILALAMGKGAFVCRGELKTMTNINQEVFWHGWVETEDKVYDTTWKIILDKELYYKIFGAELGNRRSAEQFFTDCKEMSDWHIYTKDYYENEYNPANLLIFQVHQMAELHLQNPKDEQEKKFFEKLKKDLPDINKIKLLPETMRYRGDLSSLSEDLSEEEPNQ